MKSDVFKPDPNHIHMLQVWTVRSHETMFINRIQTTSICYKCKRSDHMKSDVYKPDPNQIHKCYRCKQSDHMKSDVYKPDQNHIHMLQV